MASWKTKPLIFACAVVLTVGALQAESRASRLCDWLFGRRAASAPAPVATTVAPPWESSYAPYTPYYGYRSANYRPWTTGFGLWTTNYRPTRFGPYVAGYPTSYSSSYPDYTSYYGGAYNTSVRRQVVVNYVPQTRYRTRLARVPVTVFRPVTGSDPITGCPVTYMQACTTWSWRLRRVPYTTYRPVYTTAYVGSPSCGICAGGQACAACGGVGCPSCATTASAAPTTSAAPSLPSPLPGASSSPAPVPGTSSTGIPTLDRVPTRSGAPTQGAATADSTAHRVQKVPGTDLNGPRVKPLPDPEAGQTDEKSNGAPHLFDPGNHTAFRPVGHVRPYTPQVRFKSHAAERAPAAKKKWDDGGWRSAVR